jgi:hypothetical protein
MSGIKSLLHRTVMAVHAKSEVAGGYNTGFTRGGEEAPAAITQFDNGSLKSIDGHKTTAVSS